MTKTLKKHRIERIGCFLVLMGFVLADPAWALPSTRAEQVDHDPMGVWRRSRNFDLVRGEGAKIVFLPEEHNFFAYWVPENYRSGRVMVAVHGTGGTPYEELKDEIPMARQFDYLVIAVSWFDPRTGFMSPEELYRQILLALDYVRKTEGNDLQSVAYIGFSRGSAVSYEVAYRDIQSEKLFDFFIAHSGGIARNLKTEFMNPDAQPDPFLIKLSSGALGKDALKGTGFFLYSGDKDVTDGQSMSDKMSYAKELIEKNGGTVVEWVRRADLGHPGLRQDRSINEKAVRYFIERTPQGN